MHGDWRSRIDDRDTVPGILAGIKAFKALLRDAQLTQDRPGQRDHATDKKMQNDLLT
jgi:hypothetical protein